MLWLLILILTLVAGYFGLQVKHTNRIIRQVLGSIKEGNSLILEKPFLLGDNFPLRLCQNILEENAEKMERLVEESNRRTHTFNEILGGMLDGAMILDGNHLVTFSNSVALQNFSPDGPMKGRRIEAFIDAFEVLELLDKLSRGKKPSKAEFSYERRGKITVYEITCGLLSPVRSSQNEVYLLLLRDITEIKRTERLRKDFVANASHELRTPVTMIKGFSETLIEEPEISHNQSRSFISKIHKNALRLKALVDDLLSISELEGSEQAINPTNNKLSDVIRGIDLYLQDKPYVDSEKLVFSLEKEREAFPFDAIKIAMAIGNLIDNAFKYAGNFSAVKISTQLSDDRNFITCSVYDDGNGIPANDLDRIFERFYVVDKGRSREKGGTGLGLSIVKRIIEAHGGNVRVKSKLGEGTIFSFELPRIAKV